MARAALKKTTSTSRKTTEAPAQKRLPGRPAGSKNRVSTAGKTAKRVLASSRKVPASPKMNKSELEAHVAKLERSISRLREQVKGFKLAAADRPKIVEPVAKAARKPIRGSKTAETPTPSAATPAKAPRRSAKSPVPNGSPVVA